MHYGPLYPVFTYSQFKAKHTSLSVRNTVLEKLMVTTPVERLSAIYRKLDFIVVIKTACH
jgi:hypothetical protein